MEDVHIAVDIFQISRSSSWFAPQSSSSPGYSLGDRRRGCDKGELD